MDKTISSLAEAVSGIGDGATVKLRLLDNQTQLTPDQLAAWMEHFQDLQAA